ncbi:hypothetical protein [Stutzerimonas kunmingensis]|uniref:Uncharacterized protein n=1 Tax=Stutzerimonas kunmingensis TaxID=1211807 RepID=A0A9X1N459_9GAMM|nr:hypothetical protein [Stutzerimonas kunmingensis]MCD1608631.1 hypothetical protein [Stutzerimonas kunmingensis]
MKISEMSLAERDEYVCRQAAAVLRSSGYDMPEVKAVEYLLEMDEEPGLRFDVLQAVFDCIAFTLAHKRYDYPTRLAMSDMLLEIEAEHREKLTDLLFEIADAATRDELVEIFRG